jgi:hypothetical protein
MSQLTPGEAAVMTRFDLGVAECDIAADLEISVARVRAIVATFDNNPAHDRHREALVRRGSRRLLWHVRRAGGHR